MRLESKPGSLSDEQRAEAERVREQFRVQRREAFDSASFLPYGLDSRWGGVRWLAGSGRRGNRVDRLELGHGGFPYESDAPRLTVETLSPAGISDDRRLNLWAAQRSVTINQLQRLWRATGVGLTDDVREAVFSRDRPSVDPTAPWSERDLRVNGVPVAFHVLGNDEHWIAQAPHSGLLLAITAHAWSMSAVELVEITDLTPYKQGTRELGL
jgi:hypothetical protein